MLLKSTELQASKFNVRWLEEPAPVNGTDDHLTRRVVVKVLHPLTPWRQRRISSCGSAPSALLALSALAAQPVNARVVAFEVIKDGTRIWRAVIRQRGQL